MPRNHPGKLQAGQEKRIGQHAISTPLVTGNYAVTTLRIAFDPHVRTILDCVGPVETMKRQSAGCSVKISPAG